METPLSTKIEENSLNTPVELIAIASLITKSKDSAIGNSNFNQLADIVHNQIVKSIFTTATLITAENIKEMEFSMETNKDVFAKSKVTPLLITILDKVIAIVNPAEPDRITKVIMSIFKSIRIKRMVPFVMPLDLEDYRALRKFIRVSVSIPSEKVPRTIRVTNPKLALIQEINKFDEFFATLIPESETSSRLIIDSKFRTYSFVFESDPEKIREIAEIKRFVKKNGKMRVGFDFKFNTVPEDGTIYIVTIKECVAIEITSFTKKVQ